MVASPAPELPTGEPIEPPLPQSTCLPEAQLITAGEVAGTPQQRPNAEETGAAGTSSGGILVTPPKWQHVMPTELIDDPMLASDVLKQFQDTASLDSALLTSLFPYLNISPFEQMLANGSK